MSDEEAVESTATEIPPEAPESPVDATPDPGEAEDFKPPASELVALDEQDVFRAMDRADEELILDELMGRQLGVMVYSFPQDGKKLTDLSYAGVAEGVRTLNARGMAKIRIAPVPPVIEEFVQDGRPMVRVMVYGEDQLTGGGDWGTAVEPTRMKLKKATADKRRTKGEQIPEDDTVFDKFAVTKALSKAQRNALKPLLPVEIVQALVAQFEGNEARVRRIRVGTGGNIADLPPALADDEAGEQLEKIRSLYGELKELSRLVLPPGKFNAYLTQVQHSHERMDEFIAHLEQLIVETQERLAAEAEAAKAGGGG